MKQLTCFAYPDESEIYIYIFLNVFSNKFKGCALLNLYIVRIGNLYIKLKE